MEVAQLARRLKLASWAGIPDRVAELSEQLAEPAGLVKRSVAGVLTACPAGLYLNPQGPLGLWFEPAATRSDRALVKAAAEAAVGRQGVRTEPLTLSELASGPWVKVAYSPFFRWLGETTNFFPGQYPGGLPNHPGPLSGMLTSGLLGAGLGYGTGWALEQAMPRSWKRGKARKLFALLGAIPGAALGAGGVAKNIAAGRSLNDPYPFNHAAPDAVPGLDFVHPQAAEWAKVSEVFERLPVELNPHYVKAAADFCKAAWPGADETGVTGPGLAVRLNDLGQTLYDGGVVGPTRHAIMAAAAIASQLPGGAGPQTANPHQFGQLAQRLGGNDFLQEGLLGGLKGYIGGRMAGSALGLLGAPGDLQQWMRTRGTMLGVAEALLPHLLGQ